MTKMSPEERQKRRDKVASEALESVAKSEQFNFRVDADTIKRLYAIAGEQRKPVGALVREWILDRLQQEQASPSPGELMKELHEFRRETVACLRALSQNFAAPHTSPAIAQAAPLAFSTEQTSESESWGHASSACMHLAESVPMPVPCPMPLPKMPKIPQAELIMLFNSLQPAKPGYCEVPDWMIEYFKDQLQAR
jgi:hypothetical protein